MARPPRLQFAGSVYHVTARGNERRPIFRDDRDRNEYLRRIGVYRDRFGFQLLSFCLMTNHLHLAIRTGNEPLSRVMGCLHSSYAEWFNRRYDRVGHLFQGRYKAFLVQEDRYLLALVRYIHSNPVRAGLAAIAADYPWSSDSFFRSGTGPAWLDVDFVLAVLAPTKRKAIRRYAELVDGVSPEPAYEEDNVIDQSVKGDEAFALGRFEAAGAAEPPLKGLTERRLIEAVAQESDLTVAELTGPRRGGHVAFARTLAAYVARRYGGISIRRLARRLCRDDSTFTRPLASLENRLAGDLALRGQIDRIVQRLRQP